MLRYFTGRPHLLIRTLWGHNCSATKTTRQFSNLKRYPPHSVCHPKQQIKSCEQESNKHMSVEEAQIVSMGFTLPQAQCALQAAGSSNVEAAVEWLLALTPRTLDTLQPVVGGGDGGLGPAAESEPNKMVLVVRNDLGMGTGKIASQCAHAAVDAVLGVQAGHSAEHARWLATWLDEGCAKIVLGVDSETELRAVLDAARIASLPATLIRDAGRTQVEAGSSTVVAVGPAPVTLVNTATGKLKLL
eukprot:PhM_4_TR3034/c1_g1_i1/m.93629/K04794/PTH2; peptidyl-tRNA hydrolase, PTH2 family